jgi:hypothetical protein
MKTTQAMGLAILLGTSSCSIAQGTIVLPSYELMNSPEVRAWKNAIEDAAGIQSDLSTIPQHLIDQTSTHPSAHLTPIETRVRYLTSSLKEAESRRVTLEKSPQVNEYAARMGIGGMLYAVGAIGLIGIMIGIRKL